MARASVTFVDRLQGDQPPALSTCGTTCRGDRGVCPTTVTMPMVPITVALGAVLAMPAITRLGVDRRDLELPLRRLVEIADRYRDERKSNRFRIQRAQTSRVLAGAVPAMRLRAYPGRIL